MRLLHHTKNYTLTGDQKVTIQVKDETIHKYNNKRIDVTIEPINEDEFLIKGKTKSHIGEIVSLKQNEATVMINGNTYSFTIDTEIASKRKAKLSKKAGAKIEKINAPLPGEIVAALVGEGAEVHKGEPIMILEAMKMQNEITSPINGRVKSIQVKAQETVMKDQLLFEIEPLK